MKLKIFSSKIQFVTDINSHYYFYFGKLYAFIQPGFMKRLYLLSFIIPVLLMSGNLDGYDHNFVLDNKKIRICSRNTAFSG